MNLTVLAWLGTFVVLSGLSLRRPAYGVSLYLFTFFINPPFWWWGDLIEGYRWNLLAAIILGVSLLLNRRLASVPAAAPGSTSVGMLALLMAGNAVLVHVLFAPVSAVSYPLLELLLKFVLLYFLMLGATRSRADLRIVLWSMILAASYIGYEVMVNDRGNFSGGRLEGIGAAGVQNSNQLSSLLLAIIPFGGYLFLTSPRWRDKLLAAVATSLSLNVLLLCNSRGALLGLMLAGIIVLLMAPRAARGKVIKGLALGGVALTLLLGDPRIIERFMSIFVSAEERDSSAQTRTVIWSAALRQIADHPLGAGGESFAKVYGRRYLPEVGYDSDGRAVHNGYLNEICNWGFQGLLLRLAFLAAAFRLARRSGHQCGLRMDQDGALLAACLISATAGTLVTAAFGDYLDDEWLIWLAALMVLHSRIYTADVTVPASSLGPADQVRVPRVAALGVSPG